jgi:hypothetical protein
MWQVCFAVFVIPTAIFTALDLLGLLIYGGEQSMPGLLRLMRTPSGPL